MPEHDQTHALEAKLAVFIDRVRHDLEHGVRPSDVANWLHSQRLGTIEVMFTFIKATGVPLNPQGPGQQTIPGSGPGGNRVPDLKVRGREGSVRLRGTIVEVKASNLTPGNFGDLSGRSRDQILVVAPIYLQLTSAAFPLFAAMCLSLSGSGSTLNA